jgi:hypothetical protein
MPVPSMPSLPAQDGVDARICTGIRKGASAVSAVNRLTHVIGTSLPLPPTGEHDAIGGPSGTFLSPPCALHKHGGGSPQTQLHDCLYGSMAPSPRLSMVKTPSVSKLVFYQPARLAAPLNAEVLADLKATSWDIAFTISEGHQIPDGWGIVHLARHMDLLAGCPCAIEALSRKLDCEKARWQGGIATFRNHQFRPHSCNQYADGFGWILDELQEKSGYSASWLLSELMVPAAAPSHSHQTMGGVPQG